MKTSDIPERPILEHLARHQGEWCWWFQPSIGDGDLSVWPAFPPDTPAKLLLSKMRKLIRRGLVEGCDCGCRGDYEITDAGLAVLGLPRTSPMICGPSDPGPMQPGIIRYVVKVANIDPKLVKDLKVGDTIG